MTKPEPTAMPHVARSSGATDARPRNGARQPPVLLVSGALGFSAAVVQLALLRELLGTFSGNELTYGVALSCWLLLTALGTWSGSAIRRVTHPVRLLVVATAGLSVVALALVLAIRGLRDTVVPHGAVIDPIAMAIPCTVVLLPFCVGSGALLTLACRALAPAGDRTAIGRVYAADATGAAAGAACFTFVLAPKLDHLTLLGWQAAAVLAIGAWIGWRHGAKTMTTGCAAAAVMLAGVARFAPLDAWSTQWQHRGAIVHRTSSPYGRLVVTRDAGQLTFFENGAPIVFTANAVAVEEIAHYALAQRPGARSVLLIGGGVAGVGREILRHPSVRQVTCLELDPDMISAGRALLPEHFADARLRFVATDGRRFVQQTAERFDAILIALPDPTTFQLNRFFTAEFFAEAKRTLAPAGVLAFGLGHYENYVSPELQRLLGSARRTLASAFAHVVSLPGGRVYFIGSDRPLHRDIAGALAAQGVAARLANRHYLAAALAPDRLADIDRAVATAAPLNSDFRPVLYLLRLRQWITQFTFPARGLGTALGLVLVVCLIRLHAVPRMVFAAGVTASGLELVLLVAFQVFYGSVYRQVGLVVATFMLGLAGGAAIATRLAPASPRHAVRRLAVALALIAGLAAMMLPQLGAADRVVNGAPAGQAFILALTFLLAAAVGAQFSFAAAAAPGTSARAAPRIFSADLVGAALGGLGASAFLIPWCGVTATCLLIAGLNLLAAGLASRSQGQA